MTDEVGFLVTAAGIVLMFGLKLLFGGLSTTGVQYDQSTNFVTRLPIVAKSFVLGFGWNVSPWLLLIALALLSVFVFLILTEVFRDSLLVPVLATMVFDMACVGLMRDIVDWRARRFETKLVDVVDTMIPVLRFGDSTLSALKVSANSPDKVIQKEFSELVTRIDMGLELPRAMSRMKELYDSEGVRLFGMALEAKARYGGDLSATLAAVNVTMREKLKLRMQMIGMLSGIRLAAFIIAAAPYLLYSFFLWLQPSWISSIHNHEFGSKLLYGALLIQVAGMYWIVSIFDSEI